MTVGSRSAARSKSKRKRALMSSHHTNPSAGCPCDRLPFPPKPDIPAGLAALPRQLAGFPEFRAAMLAHIPAHRLMDADIVPVSLQQPLQDWRAREGDDLGIMLIEMWAYVLDVLAFYEERIANETYLQTPSARYPCALVELIGYHARPASASSVTLSLMADRGKGLISIPKWNGLSLRRVRREASPAGLRNLADSDYRIPP